MKKVRISLRHTGDPKLRFGVSRGQYSNLHWNLLFGRFFLAIRDKRSDPPTYKPKFMDLEFGRTQLKNRRLWDGMTEDEQDLYANYNPEHLRLEYFLKKIRNTNV